MAGVYKVFLPEPLNRARKYCLPFAGTFLPAWSLGTVGTVIPFVALIGMIPRLALLLFVLMLPSVDDRYSAAYLLARYRRDPGS